MLTIGLIDAKYLWRSMCLVVLDVERFAFEVTLSVYLQYHTYQAGKPLMIYPFNSGNHLQRALLTVRWKREVHLKILVSTLSYYAKGHHFGLSRYNALGALEHSIKYKSCLL